MINTSLSRAFRRTLGRSLNFLDLIIINKRDIRRAREAFANILSKFNRNAALIHSKWSVVSSLKSFHDLNRGRISTCFVFKMKIQSDANNHRSEWPFQIVMKSNQQLTVFDYDWVLSIELIKSIHLKLWSVSIDDLAITNGSNWNEKPFVWMTECVRNLAAHLLIGFVNPELWYIQTMIQTHRIQFMAEIYAT